MIQETQSPLPSKLQKRWPITFISVVSIAVIITLGYTWKKNTDSKKELISNRVIASKNIKIGTPFPEDFDQIVDLKLLEKDALEGNLVSKEAWELFQHRKSARESIALGKPTPENMPDAFDYELLKSDADAGNPEAKLQLELHTQRQLSKEHIQLGKEVPEKILNQIDIELLKQDAEAGNSEMMNAWTLIKNRNEAATRCVLGQPFSMDFYDHVDRSILEKDAEAGYATSKDTLKLIDNRIKAVELTIPATDYPKNFLELVDKDLLVADADAGNAEMQYIWARFNHDKGNRLNVDILKKYYALAAALNHAGAQYNLGVYYQSADNGDRDLTKTAELYKLSAENGYPLAMNALAGMMLNRQPGYKANDKLAIEWLTKAAEGGEPRAIYSLGKITLDGVYGVKKNPRAGLALIKKAIDLGHIEGIHYYTYNLRDHYPRQEYFALKIDALRLGAAANQAYSMAWYGRMLIFGEGVEKNPIEGGKWVQKSAALGNNDGISIMADIYRDGAGNIKRDVQKATELYKQLAEKGSIYSMHNLALFYSHGRQNVKQDYKQAYKYIKMHVDHGGEKHISWLAYLYYTGRGVEVDVEKAIALYEKAITLNHKSPYANLGLIYRSDDFGKKDIALALKYYKEGAEVGDLNSIDALGGIYSQGVLVGQDVVKAVEFYQQAVKRNFKHSQFNLAEIYEKGKGEVKMNSEAAIKLYQAAAKQGHEPAIEALKRLGVK